jgi:hypothetical protein
MLSIYLRRTALLFSLVVAAFAYHLALRAYLAGLDRPGFLEFSFLASLGIGCFYEFKHGSRWDYSLANCLVSCIVFLTGVLLAPMLRSEYIAGLEFGFSTPQAIAWMGADLHAAVSTRLVGYGGCFALGVMLSRLTVGSSRLRGWVVLAFIPPQNRIPTCPCCGQKVAAT